MAAPTEPHSGRRGASGHLAVFRWIAVATLITSLSKDALADEGVARRLDPIEETEAVTPPAPSWRFEEFRSRFSYFDQRGRGLQSQADPDARGGSERLRVYQPMLYARFRQREDVTHTVTLPVDIVTSASADSLDATTSASRTNEAGSLDIQTSWDVTEDQSLLFRGGAHIEEPLRSMFAGLGYTRFLAEDNASFTLMGNAIFDLFDPVQPDGEDLGFTRRATVSLDVSIAQVLSRTTVATLAYGVTHQWGTLEQTWNSLPIVCEGGGTACANRPGEIFPGTRTRHALTAFVAQRIVPTDSTLRLRYRFYSDDVDVVAHSFTSEIYQYLTRRAYVALRYRFHRQSAVSFFTESVTVPDPPPIGGIYDDAPRTADSDLAAFDAHEVGAKLLVYLHDPRRFVAPDSIDLGYLIYDRANGLRVHVVTASYALRF